MKFSVVFHEYAQSSIVYLVNQYSIPKSTVEIGAFEGHTTFNVTNEIVKVYPEYRHYVIDPFGFSDDLPSGVIADAEKVFRENLSTFSFKDNIEFMNTTSWQGLLDLHRRNVKVDFVYIDGDHRAATVLEDMVLSFQLLNSGGIMLCDDSVSWKHHDSNRIASLHSSPKLAVDNFIQCNWDRIEVITLPNGYQTAVRRL
jgi:predicted O-methyltransferase YrrM